MPEIRRVLLFLLPVLGSVGCSETKGGDGDGSSTTGSDGDSGARGGSAVYGEALATGTLLGTVHDLRGEPVPGATVELAGSSTTTDDEGAFSLEGPTGYVALRATHGEHGDWTGQLGWVAGTDPVSIVLPDLPTTVLVSGDEEQIGVDEALLSLPTGAFPPGTELEVQLLSGTELVAASQHLSFVDGGLRPVVRSLLSVSATEAAEVAPTVQVSLPAELSAHDTVVYSWDGAAWSTALSATVVDEHTVEVALPTLSAASASARQSDSLAATIGVCSSRGPSGVVTATGGSVAVEFGDPDDDDGGYSRELRPGDTVSPGEQVVTRDGYVRLDSGGTQVTIGGGGGRGAENRSGSHLCSDHSSSSGGTSVYAYLKGRLQSSTSQEGGPQSRELSTSTGGGLANRGTVYLAEEREDGLYVEVTDGAVDVTDGTSTWTVEAGQSLLCPSCLTSNQGSTRRSGPQGCSGHCSSNGRAAVDGAGNSTSCEEDEVCEEDGSGDARCVASEGGGGGAGSGSDSGSDSGEDTGEDTGDDTGEDTGDDTGEDTGEDTGSDTDSGLSGAFLYQGPTREPPPIRSQQERLATAAVSFGGVALLPWLLLRPRRRDD